MPLKKETNISYKGNMVKNPNWQEADQLATYKVPPHYNTSALNHSATLPPPGHQGAQLLRQGYAEIHDQKQGRRMKNEG